MTDNKIIKALELCSVVPQQCSQCPYYGRKDCVADSAKDAIDFMKRQQERFDRIVEQLERLPNVNSDYWNFADLIDREDAIDIVKGVRNE